MVTIYLCVQLDGPVDKAGLQSSGFTAHDTLLFGCYEISTALWGAEQIIESHPDQGVAIISLDADPADLPLYKGRLGLLWPVEPLSLEGLEGFTVHRLLNGVE